MQHFQLKPQSSNVKINCLILISDNTLITLSKFTDLGHSDEVNVCYVPLGLSSAFKQLINVNIVSRLTFVLCVKISTKNKFLFFPLVQENDLSVLLNEFTQIYVVPSIEVLVFAQISKKNPVSLPIFTRTSGCRS